MRTRLATLAVCLVGLTAQAQAANDDTSRLESCIQSAQIADMICSKIANDPKQRSDCYAKARTAQLECLDRIISEAPAEPASPAVSSEMARPGPPAETAPPKATETAPPKAAETAPPKAAETAPPKAAETAPPKASAERPASKETGRTDQRDGSAGSPRADEAAKLSNVAPGPAPASLPPPPTEAPIGAIQSNRSATNIDKPVQKADWIISETTSPIDYSPLVTAVVSSASNVKDGPNTLAVRCRSQRTELSIRTNRAWGVRRGNELLVDHQINDQPIVRQPWILSADGKTATYKNDSAEFLRSIPDGATLKLAVADTGNARLEATFELSGLSGVRQKVGTACKWAPLSAKTSSEKP